MTLTDLAGLWGRLFEVQPAPADTLVWATAAGALLAVAYRRSWLLSRNVITLVHEGGHAAMALATGRRLSGIRLHSDTSGVTVTAGRPTGPGMVLTAAAGYVAPSLVGLGAAALLDRGLVTVLLWSATALLAAMLVMIRNLFGVVSVVTTGAVVLAVSWYAGPATQSVFGYLFCWLLVLGGVRPVWELQRKRARGRAGTSDADQLARLTGVPGIVWVLLFGAVTVVVLALAVEWLLPWPVVLG